jgi:hypothetical protein
MNLRESNSRKNPLQIDSIADPIVTSLTGAKGRIRYRSAMSVRISSLTQKLIQIPEREMPNQKEKKRHRESRDGLNSRGQRPIPQFMPGSNRRKGNGLERFTRAEGVFANDVNRARNMNPDQTTFKDVPLWICDN